MSKLTFENVTKKFGKVTAVDHLNLKVKDKEFLVLLGPSGCGKTTILRLVAGLEKLDEGSIYLDGTVINDLSPKDRNIAMVFQDYALYPHLNVFDNMGFALRNFGVPKLEVEKKVKETAKLLEIGDLLERKPKQLSGGQKQRVALGRAIVREPKIFLLDEPLANLDAKLRVEMRKELKKLQHRLGVTTIYVTHDQVEAMALGHRIAVLREGMLQQTDSADNLYNHPTNKFVAGFIGSPSMNFFECDLIEKHGKLAVDAGFFVLPLHPKIARSLISTNANPELILGVRPESIYVTDGEHKNAITACVETVETLGAYQIAYLTVDRTPLTVQLNPADKIRTKKIKILFGEKIHLFNRKTKMAFA